MSTPAAAPGTRLESRGVHVSKLGFGAAPIGDLYGAVNPEVALETVRAALGGGIRLLDTAPTYGAGLSERRLGAALRDLPRAAYTLESKVGRLLEGDQLRFDLSERGLERSLAGSLERLGVEALDLVLLHDPDDFEPEARRVALPTLLRWRDAGRVRAVGVGMNQSAMPLRFLEVFDLDVVLVAGRYTLLEWGALELLDTCAARGVACFAAGVFNSGILAGGARPGARHHYAPASPAILERVARLEAVCATHRVSLHAAAIQFALAHPGVTSAVLGAVTPLEVRANLDGAHAAIPEDFWLELRARNLLPKHLPIPASPAPKERP